MSADCFTYAKNSHNDYATSTLDASAPADLLRDNSPACNAVKSAMADYTQPFQKGTLEAGLSHQHHYRQRYSLGAGPAGQLWSTDFGKTNHFVYQENVRAAYASFSRDIKKVLLLTRLLRCQSALLAVAVGDSVLRPPTHTAI